MVALLEVPAELVTDTVTMPRLASAGARTLIWVGLTYCRNAGLLLICTLTPPSDVGMMPLTRSEEASRRVVAARADP